VPGGDQLRGLPRRVEAVALLSVAGLALLFHATLPSRLPDEADGAAVAEVIARERQPGDAVLLHPWWTERARLFVPEEVPVWGYLGSDGAALERAPRIWVLSQPELPRARTGELWEAFRPGRQPMGKERRFGHLRLSLFRNGRARPTLYSAADALASARAYVESAGARTSDCPFDGRAFACPGAPARAGVGWHEVAFEPRRCVSLSPPGGQARLVVELPPSPAADRLSLEAGLIWERAAYTNPHLRPVVVGVDGAGGTLAQVTIAPGEEGFHRQVLPGLPAGSLRLWIRAEVAESREVCVDLLAQGPEAGGAP